MKNTSIRSLGLVALSIAAATTLWTGSGAPSVKAAGPSTFTQMVSEALAQVPALTPAEAFEALRSNPETLVVDVRDAADAAAAGIIPGAVNISLGTLAFKADNQVPPEWRDPSLANRARPIITTCASGEMGALGGKLLMDLGFTNVHLLRGGTLAWQAAGYPVQALSPGWVYHYDPAKNQWTAKHYAMTASGIVVDGEYEMKLPDPDQFHGCALTPYGQDC